MNTKIEVAAAVIRKNGKTLICSRPQKSPLTGFFEFPGGKCEPGETIADCAVRELKEELGIHVLTLDQIHVLEHDYPDKSVRVHFIRCIMTPDSPAPQPLDGQQIRFIDTENLYLENFLPADRPLSELFSRAFSANQSSSMQ